MEQVFNEVEQTFIQRGRARPDHNDQAHHYKSKWARGVSPSDLFIVIGGCEINNIGRIHADASQRNKNAIFPQGYEATKWFWSAKRPGNIVRYILNISVLHKPPPPEQFVNNTVSQGSETDLAALLKIKNKPISNTEAPRRVTKAKTFSYDDFETIEVELEEIAPPPKLFAPRKRSCDNQSDESGSIGKRSRISRSNTRRQKALELEEVPEEADAKNDVLLTDDEDTESMTVRRSVRVWSNKIKKELVEEHLPDEIDGWKIPTDDEELENGEDALDSSFTLTPARESHKPVEQVVEAPEEVEARGRRVKSQKVGKYKSATQKTKTNGKKKRKRRIVSESESDDEWGRQNSLAIDEVIEELGPSYDQIQAAAEADDDSVLPPVMRPNNIEIISMDQIKTRLISSEEEDDQEQKVKPKRISDSESDRSSPVENPLKSPSLGESSPKIEPEAEEKVESPKVEEKEVKAEVEEKIEAEEVAEDVPEVESEAPIPSPKIPEEKSPEKNENSQEVIETIEEKEAQPVSQEVPGERVATPTPDVASLKKKLCNRGSPKIVLERLKVEPEKLAEVTEQLAGEKSQLEKSYEEQVVASIVAAGPVILSKNDEKSSEDEQKETENVEKESEPELQEDTKSEIAQSGPEIEESDEKVVSESESEKSESDEKSETPDDDYEEEVENEDDEAEIDDSDEKPESPKRSSTPLRQSPRTKVSPKTEQVLVRRSARERRSFRCPIKGCEEKAMTKMDKMLLHVKVNHPTHYAGLITRKHSAVFKICSQVISKLFQQNFYFFSVNFVTSIKRRMMLMLSIHAPETRTL